MKRHSSKPLISFRKLQGGQFGTLDVLSIGSDYVQLALGSDFIYLTRPQWISLRSVIDRFFQCEKETVVLSDDAGEPVVFETIEEEVEVEAVPIPAPARNRTTRRRAVG